MQQKNKRKKTKSKSEPSGKKEKGKRSWKKKEPLRRVANPSEGLDAYLSKPARMLPGNTRNRRRKDAESAREKVLFGRSDKQKEPGRCSRSSGRMGGGLGGGGGGVSGGWGGGGGGGEKKNE